MTRPEGPCTAVVAAKLDRLFRDAADCLNMSRRWDDAEVGLHLIDMGIDTRSAMGRAFLTMAAGFAELERNLIGERTKAGQAVIRRIVEQYEAGRGFVAIARSLNTDKVPTKRGGEWRDNTVRQIHQMEMARRDGGAE